MAMSTKHFFSFDSVKNFDKHIANQIIEYKELDSLIKDISVNFILVGSYQQKIEAIGRSVPPLLMKEVALKAKELLDGTTN